MSTLEFDPTNPLPLYFQLKQKVRQEIEAGLLKPGDRLPSEKELEEQYGISRITIRQALGALANEGYLKRHRGRGTFVAAKQFEDSRVDRLGAFLADLANEGHIITCPVLKVHETAAPSRVASVLDLDEGQSVIEILRIALVDGEPIAVVRGWLAASEGLVIDPLELAPHVSVYTYLEQKLGIRVVRAEKTLEASLATAEEASMLGIRRNGPVLLARILFFTADNRPVVYIKSIYRGDRYKYFITLTK